MVIIGRNVSDITINPLEYKHDNAGKSTEFINAESTKKLLHEHGITKKKPTA